MTSSRLASKLLLIGWDAADWKVINPLLDAGRLPNLSRLVDEGVIGNIATLQPCLSPILWTSIATGKTADKHGITGFVEPLPTGEGVRLSSSTSRKTKAIWNMLSQRGLRSVVVGWYATHPAEPIDGACISNRFLELMPADPAQPWELVAGAVHPESLSPNVRELRMHPAELRPQDLVTMIPRIGEIDLSRDARPGRLARALANCVSIHAVATAAIAEGAWDFAAVYYDTLDVVGHDFMPYYPPRLDHISPEDFELYSHVIPELYCFHDQMLGRLLNLAGDDTTVVLLSDHGFHSDHLRPRFVQGDTPERMAAAWHRPFGVLAARGPGILKDERVYGANLLDIAPTVLMLFGLPLGADMDGRPLSQILENAPSSVAPIPSWDDEPGDAGMHPAEMREDPFAASAAIQQLISLGYLPSVAEDAHRAVEIARAEGQFNLANVHLHHGRPARALEHLEALRQAYPDEPRYLIAAAKALAELHRYQECRRLIDQLEAKGCRSAESDVLLVASWMAERDFESALARVRDAESRYPRSPTWYFLVGKLYLGQQLWQQAQAQFEEGLECDGDYPLLHNGLAQSLLKQHEYERAAEHALRAVGLVHYFPEAHYHLGAALAGLGENARAIQAMEIAVAFAPHLAEAHWHLAHLYEQQNDLVKSLKHRSLATGHESPFL